MADEVEPVDPLEIDPMTIEDPRERARLIFVQWHVDEVTSAEEADAYATRLLERLHDAGLAFRKAPRCNICNATLSPDSNCPRCLNLVQ